MSFTLDSYRDQRDKFLSQVVRTLSKEDRFVAGWLTGSLSKNGADSVSDIDLSLVVSEDYSSDLCSRFATVSKQTSLERFSLISQFGAPALIHENNNNAPDGGTMTFVLYANSAIMVDWVLIPQSKAQRPYQSKLLFDKVGISVVSSAQPEDFEQRKKFIAERWAFFWMMSAITIKYMIRDDGVFVAQWIENLHSLEREMERQLNGEPWGYRRGSLTKLQTTRENQIESLKQLCMRMAERKPRVAEFTESELLLPAIELELLFALVDK
jgi:hypothetical protein